MSWHILYPFLGLSPMCESTDKPENQTWRWNLKDETENQTWKIPRSLLPSEFKFPTAELLNWDSPSTKQSPETHKLLFSQQELF